MSKTKRKFGDRKNAKRVRNLSGLSQILIEKMNAKIADMVGLPSGVPLVVGAGDKIAGCTGGTAKIFCEI